MNSIKILTVLVWFLHACTSEKKDTAVLEQPVSEEQLEIILTSAQMQKAGVTTGILSQRSIRREIHVNGVVDVPPQNMVSVSFPLGGYLKSTKLLPGMHVRKGEVIGIMEDQSLIQLQQDYLIAKARLEYLEKDYARQKTLNEDKVNADKAFQQATADFTSQKVTLKGFAEKLRLIGISPERLTESSISRQVPLYAPTSGYVSKVNVNVGKFIQPTDVLFELINPDDIHAALSIFEKDLGKIAIGQKVKISFVDEPEKIYEGEVILVNRNVDENRSAIAHCHFLSHPGKLLPGMFLNASIEAGGSKGQTVPEGAIVQYQGKSFIFIETAANTFLMHEVAVGATEAGFVELTAGAEKIGKSRIATANAFSLLGALKNVGEED